MALMTIRVPPATRQITVRTKERVCINCKHYERYLREADVPGENYKKLLITNTGYCLLRDHQRGALCQPCKDFETKERPARVAAHPDEAGKTH